MYNHTIVDALLISYNLIYYKAFETVPYITQMNFFFLEKGSQKYTYKKLLKTFWKIYQITFETNKLKRIGI